VKIALIMYQMGAGGAERVMSILANYWANHGHDVSLITWSSEESFYPLDPKVKQVKLGLASDSSNPIQAILSNYQRVKALRSALKQLIPDGVISFLPMNNIRAIMAASPLGIPVVVSERNDPHLDRLGRPWEWLRNKTYPRAKSVVIQTDSAGTYFNDEIRERMVTIPNPVLPPEHRRPPNPGSKRIIAVGRLVEQKGFDLLMRAFAPVSAKHPDWKLLIFGEGELRPKLEQLRAELKLENSVELPGSTKQIGAEMAASDVFVLSSRFEGFPNVLCEAMAVGLPVVSFACPSGPSEIITDGVDGLLVSAEDVDGLTMAIRRMISSDELREKIASKAPQIVERLGVEQVARLWEAQLGL